MKYSIVMPCLLREESHRMVVAKCIQAVQQFSSDYELIIVDDGSPLDTELLKLNADTYIRHNPKNKGIAPSWNDGMKVARGEYIVVINDDIEVEEGWLDKLRESITEGVGVAAPGVSHINQRQELIEENYKWFPGYCFMLPRSTVEKVGYFDEQFVPFNCEDCDYWERLLQAGLKMVRNYSVQINHKEGDTIHGMDYENVDNANVQKFIAKHGFSPKEKFYS